MWAGFSYERDLNQADTARYRAVKQYGAVEDCWFPHISLDPEQEYKW